MQVWWVYLKHDVIAITCGTASAGWGWGRNSRPCIRRYQSLSRRRRWRSFRKYAMNREMVKLQTPFNSLLSSTPLPSTYCCILVYICGLTFVIKGICILCYFFSPLSSFPFALVIMWISNMSPVKRRHNGFEVSGKLFIGRGRYRPTHTTASAVSLWAGTRAVYVDLRRALCGLGQFQPAVSKVTTKRLLSND